MNPLILILIIATAIITPKGFIGIIDGLGLCFIIFERGDRHNSSIWWHLTHWSWYDIRV
jgi:hypothetical protein